MLITNKYKQSGWSDIPNRAKDIKLPSKPKHMKKTKKKERKTHEI
jgi:hypothetical protein